MDTPSARLYDMRSDPEERHNRLQDFPDEVARLRRIGREVRGWAAVADAQTVQGVTAQLEALGYVVADADPARGAHIDAKDRTAVIARLEAARRMVASHAWAAAEDAYRAVLDAEPGLAEARLGLADVLRGAGRLDEALAVLDDAVAAAPESVVLRTNRGFVLLGLGRARDAEAEGRAVLTQVPADDDARSLVLQALLDQDPRRALAQAEDWRQGAPGDPLLHGFEGMLWMRWGRPEIAEPRLRTAARAPVAPQGVHAALAQLESLEGREELVAWHLEQEVAMYPRASMAWRALGDHRMAHHDWAAAEAAYARVLDLAPQAHDARRAWAQAVFNRGDAARAGQVLQSLLPSDDPYVLTLHANVLAARGQRRAADAAFARAAALR